MDSDTPATSPMTGVYQRLARLPDRAIALAADVRDVLSEVLPPDWELHDFPTQVLKDPHMWLFLMHHPESGRWRLLPLSVHRWDQPHLPDGAVVDPADAAVLAFVRRDALWAMLGTLPAHDTLESALATLERSEPVDGPGEAPERPA